MTTPYFNWFRLRASGEDLEHQDLVTLNDIECHYNNCKAVWYGLQEIEREVPRVYFALKPGYQVLRRASCSSVEACGLPRGHFEEEDEEPGWVFAHVPIRGSRAIQLPNLLAAAYYLKRDPLLQGYLLEDERGFYVDRSVFESTFFKLFRDCPFLSPFPEHRPIYCGYIICRVSSLIFGRGNFNLAKYRIPGVDLKTTLPSAGNWLLKLYDFAGEPDRRRNYSDLVRHEILRQTPAPTLRESRTSTPINSYHNRASSPVPNSKLHESPRHMRVSSRNSWESFKSRSPHSRTVCDQLERALGNSLSAGRFLNETKDSGNGEPSASPLIRPAGESSSDTSLYSPISISYSTPSPRYSAY
ncbi:hypothetical protein QAD02_003529 [Eretmocerus hayati]|uniref:Uncharacterized protein n=1 Tax=Eretmocerus hayati TaxID=131215 RepID=A0ACC2NRW9_9HYME|nr:hypothetical protein QAD02_003529 [Eretmocerus hayati]